MLTTKIIGNKITEARKKINISQAQLSELLFISPQAVGKWERGESMPDIITFTKLAEIFEVDLNYFTDNGPAESSKKITENEHVSNTESASPIQGKKKIGWNMSSGNWVDADFSGLNNLNEKFSSSNMQKCLFVKSDLQGLLLKNNNIYRCDFTESDISNSRIQGSNVHLSKFQNCSLNSTEFATSRIDNCDFTNADFTDALIKSCTFRDNKIVNTIWNRTSFITSYFKDIIFEGIINDCAFENCDATRLSFQNAILKNTFFKGMNLKRVQFIDCQADKLTLAFLTNGKADTSKITLIKE